MDKFFLDRIYNVFFPIKCGYCNKITENISHICNDCRIKIYMEDDNRCKFCGTKIFRENNICDKCAKAKVYYDKLVFCAEYKDVLRNRMLQYKFEDKKYLKDFFAEQLANKLVSIDIDYIIAVPISKNRMRERGYNQTNLIAKRVGKILDKQYVSDILVKTKETERQSTLSKTERKINVKDSFKVADIYKVREKKILLIDDIFTTGATVNECSKMLKKAGAKKVIVATILSKN